ncbi:cyclic AMP-responsive element-binding protein 3-like protein 2 isoform X2 [Latimeria chalumnae]|uniref:cyclic AMP-responsive element-binding protein 3-like protein 2 isoform X2 n=1 Tax=Latimeria chalumnae TaxID=7897 RepID=UPI00313AFBC6
MEVLEGGEPLLHWDRKLSELSEPGDPENFLYNTHFTEFLDEFSQDVLGQLLNDPFLSDKNELMEVELSPAPHIQAEHSYSLSGDSRPQSPLTHISTDDNFSEADLESDSWTLHGDLKPAQIKSEPLLCDNPGLVPSVTLTVTTTATLLDSKSPIQQSEQVVLPVQVPILLTANGQKLQGTGPLILTEEEKRTLIAEGYPVPTKLPLTKAEEKALKKIRRKIKNKISAQESRRKKKEYMDTLEKKVESCSNENSELRRKVETLENANRTLLQQLQRLQALVAGKVPRSCKVASTQTSTCLMVVVLCFAVVLGSFSQNYGPYSSSVTKAVLPPQHSTQEPYTATVVRSRNLLTFEERPQLEGQYSTAVSTDYAEMWDRPKSASHSVESTMSVQDTLRQYTNETTENSVLINIQAHRVHSELGMNETAKVTEID